MNLAPIVLFVYNRPLHTEQTLNALMQNDLADQSVLYIYADGPKENASEEQIKKIQEVRSLLRAKKWCEEVNIIEAEKNKGLADSIIAGVTEILNRYGKVIVLEDDIVTSRQFLMFLNKALELYEKEEIVFGISGFTYPSKFAISDTHFLPIGCSWGWATWKSRWKSINFDADYLQNEIALQKKELQFDFGNYPFCRTLEDQASGRINSWAIRYYASFFLQEKIFMYPQKSLVVNIGFDDNGTHTSSSDNFFDQVVRGEINFRFKKPGFDQNTENIRNKFIEQFYRKGNGMTTSPLSIAKKLYFKIKKIVE